MSSIPYNHPYKTGPHVSPDPRKKKPISMLGLEPRVPQAGPAPAAPAPKTNPAPRSQPISMFGGGKEKHVTTAPSVESRSVGRLPSPATDPVKANQAGPSTPGYPANTAYNQQTGGGVMRRPISQYTPQMPSPADAGTGPAVSTEEPARSVPAPAASAAPAPSRATAESMGRRPAISSMAAGIRTQTALASPATAGTGLDAEPMPTARPAPAVQNATPAPRQAEAQGQVPAPEPAPEPAQPTTQQQQALAELRTANNDRRPITGRQAPAAQGNAMTPQQRLEADNADGGGQSAAMRNIVQRQMIKDGKIPMRQTDEEWASARRTAAEVARRQNQAWASSNGRRPLSGRQAEADIMGEQQAQERMSTQAELERQRIEAPAKAAQAESDAAVRLEETRGRNAAEVEKIRGQNAAGVSAIEAEVKKAGFLSAEKIAALEQSTGLTKAQIESVTEKYKADKGLEGTKYTADAGKESVQTKADAENQARERDIESRDYNTQATTTQEYITNAIKADPTIASDQARMTALRNEARVMFARPARPSGPISGRATPAAQAQATPPAPVPAPASNPQPPVSRPIPGPDAIKKLKDNPSLREAFEKRYGPGTAATYLQG